MFNPWLILGVTVALAAFVGGAYIKGNHDGVLSERSKCNTQKQETINDNIKIRQEQDDLIRPDDAAYINSLRRRTF